MSFLAPLGMTGDALGITVAFTNESGVRGNDVVFAMVSIQSEQL